MASRRQSDQGLLARFALVLRRAAQAAELARYRVACSLALRGASPDGPCALASACRAAECRCTTSLRVLGRQLALIADPAKLCGMSAPSTTPRLNTTELLARLVSFDTTSRNSNLPLMAYVREYLDAHDVPYRVSADATGEKANIHAIIGPQQPGGVALSGHVDTVPVDGQAWSANPFTLRQSDGRLYARGSADMKGFVSACLAAVPEMKARKLARPLHLFISYDEEVGCHGAKRLIEDLEESGLKPALCVVGEPSWHAADPGA